MPELNLTTTALVPLSFETSTVRMRIDHTGSTWWVAKDICDALGILDYRQAYDRLDDDERGGYQIPTPGGIQEVMCVNESGLYNLIFRSDKPAAREFRRWVTHEVLPQIRKTGSYGRPGSQPAIPLADRYTTRLRFERPYKTPLEVFQSWMTAGKLLHGPKWAVREQALLAVERETGLQLWPDAHDIPVPRQIETAERMAPVFRAWFAVYPDGNGITVTTLVHDLRQNHERRHHDLADAIREYTGVGHGSPGYVKKLGYALRQHTGRIYLGYRLKVVGVERTGKRLWAVVEA